MRQLGPLGVTIVVKPAKGRQGQGVTVGIETDAEIEAAVAEAHKVGKDLQIEATIPGQEYRLLVIGGKFVAASQRLAPVSVERMRWNMKGPIDVMLPYSII